MWMVSMVAENEAAATVLVVEDEPLIRMNAVDFLEDEGFRVIEAGSGDEGLARLRQEPEVKVLFTDVHMPGSLDGLELARIAASDFTHVKLLIVSGRAIPDAGNLPEGAHFMAKPYAASAVVAHVRRAVQAS